MGYYITVFCYADKFPALNELNWCDEDDSVGKEELAEFLDEIEQPGLSLEKEKVVKHHS